MSRDWTKDDFDFPPGTIFAELGDRPVARVSKNEAWDFSNPDASTPVSPGFMFSDDAGFIDFEKFVRLVNRANVKT